MTTSTPTANHPPLAHADDGTRLPLPTGTTHWRILRGRDTQPARFGLEMTRDDLLELCGPGTYTIEASDQFGHRLDHVATIRVGEPAPPPPPNAPRLPGADDDYDDYGPPWRVPPPASGATLEVILDGAADPGRPEDKVAAVSHVLRVRERLAPHEQIAFDDLVREDDAMKLLRSVLARDEDDALIALRERLSPDKTP